MSQQDTGSVAEEKRGAAVVARMPAAPIEIPGTNPAAPAVSKLAAKVAHELNNPLDAVLRFVSLAQRKVKAGEYSDIERYLSDAQFGLQRMAEVLRELMDIGRQTNEILNRPETVPLTEAIAGAIRTAAAQAEQKQVTLMAKNLLPEGGAGIGAGIGGGPRYDLRLSQILSNLLKNAVEASPENGAVRVTAALVEGRVQVTVEDSGEGIPAEMLPKLFTPFVTTKGTGSGHGLGLAISRELALSLRGELTLGNRPAPQRGCVATLRLPVADG